MPTQRFEAPSLEQAVRIVRSEVGPAAKIVGATRVRRGGVGGFFAREHVELEVELIEGSGPAVPQPRAAGPAASTGTGVAPSRGSGHRPVDGHNQAEGRGRDGAGPRRRGEDGANDGRGGGLEGRDLEGRDLEGRDLAGRDLAGGDPMSELITEMAENGPSSVLDLAEQVNTEQNHYALPDGTSAPPRRFTAPAPAQAAAPAAAAAAAGRHAAAPLAAPAPAPRPAGSAPAPSRPAAPGPDNANFAMMLERIVREAGLAVPGAPPVAPGPSRDPVPASPASQASTIFTELSPSTPSGLERRPAPASPDHLGELSGLGLAVHALGLPLPACQGVRSVTTREELEQELCRALQRALPPLPGPPKLPTSIVAVVGPRDEVMEVARAVTDDIGASRQELAIATQRPVWRAQERVLGPADEVAEERRTWRWRGRPSVVAIEQPVRAGGSQWASDMLKALEPALCWGVAEASRKPEDLASWSRSLGGIDVLALVDLEGTTTPAAALAAGVPVGSLDGQPATPQLWARILCARLMG